MILLATRTDIKHTSRSGIRYRISPVISYVMKLAVNGACAAPANTPAMPKMIRRGTKLVVARLETKRRLARILSIIAPIKRRGAKIPPEPPEPSVKLVATIFRISNTRSVVIGKVLRLIKFTISG